MSTHDAPFALLRPLLDQNSEPLALSDGSLILVQRGVAPFRVADPPPLLGEFLARADGQTDAAAIFQELGLAADDPATAALVESLDRLARQGMVRESVPPPDWFAGPLAARFASYVAYLDRFASDEASGYDYFKRLRDSHVVVIGLGGAGSIAAVALAAAGIGRLTLVDGDIVESSNLIRQPFFTESDSGGRLKADAIADYLARFSAFTEVATISRFVGGLDDAREFVRGADFVCICADMPRFILQRWLNRVCVESSIPYINGFDKRIGPLWIPGRSPCFECCEEHIRAHFAYHDQMVEAMQRPARRRAPSTFLGPVLTGMIQANECIGYLSRAWAPKTESRCATVNDFGVASYLTLQRLPSCSVCGDGERGASPGAATREPARVSWSRFVREQWRRAPTALRAVPGRPLVSESAALDILRDAFERQRLGYQAHLRVYAGQQSWGGPDVYRFRPAPSEHAVAEYAARVQSEARVESITIILNHAHARAPELWFGARRFLSSLYAHTGIPDSVDCALWLSTARSTCFGVHDDPYDGFILPLCGKRVFQVWPDRAPGARHFDPDEEASEHQSFSVESGDTLYIPANMPHLGRADGAVSLQVTIAVDRRSGGLSQYLVREIGSALSQRMDQANGHHPLPFGRRSGDDDGLSSLARACRDLLSSDGELPLRITASLMRLSSAGGFRQVPPMRPAVELEDEAVIIADEPDWLLTRVEGDEILCAANGHTFSLSFHPNILAMVDRLASGSPVPVGSLVDDHATPAEPGEEAEVDREALLAIIGLLYQMRAVEIQPRD